MSKNKNTNLFWEYFYMLVITATICILPLLYYQITKPVIIAVFIVTLIALIVIWKKPMSRRLLYLLNILNVIAVACFASLIILLLEDETGSIVSFIIAIVAIDVYSFTRRGKHTLNAKLMESPTALPRLSICLRVPGKPGLQPIIGIGDLNFYTIMTLFAINKYGFTACFIVLMILVTGQLANIALISAIKHKKWFKGFPATLFPGLFYLIAFISGIIK